MSTNTPRTVNLATGETLLAVPEMGKPIGEAPAEEDRCAWACEYCAWHASTE